MKESQRTKPIRPFTKEDIPQVAEMFQRLLLSEGSSFRELPTSAVPEYFEQIFFHHPWYDEAFPSLVYQESDGKIIGFIGVVTRPMLLHGQPINVSVSFHLMVEPQSRSSMAGVQLLKTFFSGPQDLSLTDGAGTVGRKVWEGVGGTTAYLYSQRWARVLSPSRFALVQLGKRTRFPRAAKLLAPFCSFSDAVAARIVPQIFPRLRAEHSEEELDVANVLAQLPQFAKARALQPVYDDYSLQWVFKQIEQMNSYGSLKKILVRNKRGEFIGWYLYYLKPGMAGTVIQIVASKNAYGDVLDHLFEHARRHGAISLVGRLEPQYMQELADRYCSFHRMGSWTLIHSNNTELLHAIQRGDVFLTTLEGELSLLF